MDRLLLKEVVVDQREEWERADTGVPRESLERLRPHLRTPHAVLISGLRRCGKSTLLRQLLAQHYKKDAYYFTFEDERLLRFAPEDFNALYEILAELYGERKVFFCDEIQNAPQWEAFVRRMQERGFKFFITGSNASLLSRELGAKLTGRSISFELFPFSFREFLRFHQGEAPSGRSYQTTERASLKRQFNRYVRSGGLPQYLKYGEEGLLKQLYEDILYRDIATRHDIKDVRALRELGLYFLSHAGSLFSYNNLKSALGLGSMNTVRSYTDYFEDSYLLFVLDRFSYSLKRQFQNPKKIYGIDNGIIESVAFQFSRNRGKLLENLVFGALRRESADVYFYQTRSGKEVDFVVRRGRSVDKLVQVTQSLSNDPVRRRETEALWEAMEELKLSDGTILVEDGRETLRRGRRTIAVRPIYEWLLD
jgi:predicted AAA+ superfamily ATPase